MSDEEPTPKPPDPRATWSSKIPTWFGAVRASDVKAKAESDAAAAAERQVRDDKADARVDKWAERALEVSETDKGRAERMVRFQWMVIGVLVLAVITLAGHAVVVKVSQDGVVQVETTPPPP